jgi:hypothetical protein
MPVPAPPFPEMKLVPDRDRIVPAFDNRYVPEPLEANTRAEERVSVPAVIEDEPESPRSVRVLETATEAAELSRRRLSTVSSELMATEYLPTSVISADSVLVGTFIGFQSPAFDQEPPDALVHTTTWAPAETASASEAAHAE